VLLGPELVQRPSNGEERLSHEELTKRLEEHSLPTSIFGIDEPEPLTVEYQPQENGHANGSGRRRRFMKHIFETCDIAAALA
jgi:hypothetical protein